MKYVTSLIRDIPDFPKEGIVFKDITPVLSDADAFAQVVEQLAAACRERAIDKVVGIESRGFIFGAAVARALGLGFIPVRKPGKLPYETHRVEYTLEYGTDSLEMHTDAVSDGQRVVVVDDLLATGGTAWATRELIQRQGAVVDSFAFVIELAFLGGRERLGDAHIHSLIQY